MHSTIELVEGRAWLEKFSSELSTESSFWNEAQNRFQIIDRLLSEGLGWDRTLIEVENTDGSGGRADYLLGKPVRVVLEAKREALDWKLPPSTPGKKSRGLANLIAACDNFKNVVHQVIPYCSIRGVPTAVVCNGRQTAVFQAIVVGTSPLNGQCFVFDGLQEHIDKFPLLWELLSPDGVQENRAFQRLAQFRSPRIPAKASTGIPEPYKHRYRSDLQESLSTIAGLLLEDIEDNPKTRSEFYQECYVPLEANNRHLLLSKNIIERRYKRSGDGSSSPVSFGGNSVSDLTDQAAPLLGSKPIVVLGDVGVGKSSFFENLQLNIITGTEDSIYLPINLGIKANLSGTIKDFILSEIPETLKEKFDIDIHSKEFIETIYHKELIDFDGRPEGSYKELDEIEYARERISFIKEFTARKDAHLHASFAHLAHGQNRKITLVIDNADQRSFAVQQEAFLIAQELAATRNLTVFIALRPSTFYTSKASGALSAYQNKILSISPPPVDEVIVKRIAFALRVAEGKAAPGAMEGIKLNLNNIALFLTASLRSIRSNNNIKQFLSNISGGNTRAVIELITGFCGSPNVDCQKIIDIEARTGNYKVPLHEFTKHALLGEFSYYNPQSSQLATNVFDVSMADKREHFLLPLIVAFLASNHGIRDNDGFIFGEDIKAEMQRLGFLFDQIEPALRKAAGGKLIETPHSHFREIPVEDKYSAFSFHFRATSVGLYHIKFWCGSFPFLDATSTDTPIFDEDARRIINDSAASFQIESRYKKATAFRSYLEQCWNDAGFPINYYDFHAITNSNNDFETIERLIENTNNRGAWRSKRR
ncbi:hypothetical protein AB1K42_08575 [Roseibium algicola]|uniref:hypothetical protein n=1 Tax=Roseibium algicola TaxID=2857014 RepID=UPI00345A8B04